jgi:1-acyl-sn-glycerol-3-phosphate acyltransferase
VLFYTIDPRVGESVIAPGFQTLRLDESVSRESTISVVTAAQKPPREAFSHRLFQSFARMVFRHYCRLHVTGRENLPPMPFILCSNHASHLDSVALMTATGHPFANFGMLAASDYFFRRSLVNNWFSGMVQLIPISRSREGPSLGRTIKLCQAFLGDRLGDGKRSLILFPEGTRSPDGVMGPFKAGISLLSAALDVPIVPACIVGSAAVMPRGYFFPKPGSVTVHIGPPIYPGAESSHSAIVRLVENSIRKMKGAASE